MNAPTAAAEPDGSQSSLLKQTGRIWDRNVKAARLAYAQALKARFANKCAETDRLVAKTRAVLETAVARMQEDERRAERARTTPCQTVSAR